MKNIVGLVNCNYRIIQQGKTSCIGYNANKDEYVCWYYEILENGGLYCFWGTYSLDYEFTKKKYEEREGIEA